MDKVAPLSPSLRKALRPKLSATERLVRASACREVSDKTLHDQMIGNDRIAARLFDIMLCAFGLPGDEDLLAFDGQEKLAFVLGHDRDVLVQRLGLAGESHRLAQHLFDHTLASSIYDLGQVTLRDALRYRGLVEGPSPAEPLTLGEILKTGELLLTNWVWSLPLQINGRAAIALNVMAGECTPAAGKVALADAVISYGVGKSTPEGQP